MKKPAKWIAIFWAMALLGTNLEMLVRASQRSLLCPENVPAEPVINICKQGLSVASLAGWSSAWMLPVYGLAGLVLGYLNEKPSIARLPMVLQCLMGGAAAVTIEFVAGLIFNVRFKLGLWTYKGDPGDLLHQVSLVSFLMFCGVAPLAFWLDDAIRYVAYGEKRPPKLRTYYKRLWPWPARKVEDTSAASERPRPEEAA